MQRLARWAALAFGVFTIAYDHLVTATTIMDNDPQRAIDAQFRAIPPINATSSPAAAAQWLDAVDDVMTRLALGGLAQLPASARDTVDTIADVVVHTDTLLQDRVVLHKVLALTPTIWTVGYWYAPLATWQPVFSTIWTTSVAAAKRMRDSDNEPFDTAVDAAARMIRFTKDTYFINGERDMGATSDSGLESARDFMGYLPQIVEKLSCVPHYSLSEHQLRAFMNKLPSKRDGMDMSVPFPTYVDTAQFHASDVTELRKFLGL